MRSEKERGSAPRDSVRRGAGEGERGERVVSS